MAKSATITEKLFKAIKQLTEGGATIPEIAEYFKISSTSVSRCRAAETYEEYKHNAQVAYLAYRDKSAKKTPEKTEEPKEEHVKVVEHKQTVTIQATHFMMQELQKTNETLDLISRKLAYIVDQLS